MRIDKGVYRKLFDVSLNICKINRQTPGNIFEKKILEEIVKSINAEIACPFKKVRKASSISDVPEKLIL